MAQPTEITDETERGETLLCNLELRRGADGKIFLAAANGKGGGVRQALELFGKVETPGMTDVRYKVHPY